MVVFYDFDGTLTPYPVPQYEIFRTCGKDTDTFQMEVLELAQKMHINIYDAYFDTFKTMLMNKGFAYSASVVSLGAEKVEFNPGVLFFLRKLQEMGVKQYVVTSGYGDFVRKTEAAKYLDGIYGTEFKDENHDGVLDKILTDDDKAVIIKDILRSLNDGNEEVLYLGDGLTDKEAFSYVHSIGGKAVFIGTKNDTYEVLNNYGVLDEVFERDFSENSELYNYITKLLKGR